MNNFELSNSLSIESINSFLNDDNASVCGNKSLMIFSNRGMSFLMNLGKFISINAFKTMDYSEDSGSFLLIDPALFIVDFIALSP